MKADLLLDHYEKIADAPEAIIRLRHFILDLAVRGKLLEMSTKFIPTTLGEVGRWGSGGTPTKSNPAYYGGSIPWLVIGDLNDSVVSTAEIYITEAGLSNSSAKIVEPGTVLIAMYGSIGKMGIAGFRCATNQAIAHCVPDQTKISTEYLFLTLKSLSTAFVARGHGGAQQNISQTIIKSHPVSLPSLPEQGRIVAKVDELMSLCDRLEAARSAREGTRDQLAAASLARLNEPDPETFQTDACFALDAMPALTTRSDQIKALRQTILNLAVRGKLVLQDASDEPASELLKRIRAWQRHGIEQKTIRAPRKPLVPTAAGDDPYPKPDGWMFVRLGELIYIQSGDGLTSANMNGGSVPVFGGNGVNGHHDQHNVDQSTVVIGRVGYYCGSIHVTPSRAWVTDNAFVTHFSENEIYLRFLVILLTATNLKEDENATAQPVISGSKIYPIVVGLPPLAEQHRIVAKVDELMGLCDRLEASLTATAATRRRLLDALLAEALDPLPLAETA